MSVRPAIFKYMKSSISIVLYAGEPTKIGSTIPNEDGRLFVNGFFRDEGLVGILYGKEMKTLENISLFNTVVVDRACG